MNYQKIYDALIDRARSRCLDVYMEGHHIIPRCMGGSDEKENIVRLTPEEHYVAHQLLVKIYNGNHKLVRAAQMMIPNRPSNKLYGWLRRRFSNGQKVAQTGKNNSQYGKIWINKDNVPKSIHKNDLQMFLDDGWIIGRSIKTPKIKTPKVVKTKTILEILRSKHYKIRNSFAYRNALARKIYNEFISSGLSLRKFSDKKNMVTMTLSKMFRKHILEYRERT